MSPYNRVVTALWEKGSRHQGNNWQCPVPSHGQRRGDQNPSLTVSRGDDGRVLLYCHGGCSVMEDVLPALGIEPPELFPGHSILSLYPKERHSPIPKSGLLSMPPSPARDFLLAMCYGRFLASDGSHRTVSRVQDISAVVWDKPDHRREFLAESGVSADLLKKRIRQWVADGWAHRCQERRVLTFILRPEQARRCPRCWVPIGTLRPLPAGTKGTGRPVSDSVRGQGVPFPSTVSAQPEPSSLEVVVRGEHG